MDTRQLAAFCAVVERKSFSQAAERLGVTQPAVSLQVRSLEKRLGRKLLDRSGRSVEPTEAGQALYRGAQRLLALEGQLLEELEAGEAGELGGTLEVGASTGPGSTVVPVLLCEFQRQNPGVAISLSISDTQSVVDRVADRELELGVVGAARRHRGVVFEPFFRDEVVLACPPDHRFAGRTIELDELREEPLIVMQEGRGRPAGDRGRAPSRRDAGCGTSSRASSSACRSRRGRPSPPATASRSSRAPRSRPISRRARLPSRASKGSILLARSRSFARPGARRRARPRPSSTLPGSGSSDRSLGARGAARRARRGRHRAPVSARERPLGAPRPARERQVERDSVRPDRRRGC